MSFSAFNSVSIKWRRLKALLLCALLSSGMSLPIFAKEVVKFAVADFPPWVILVKDKPVRGIDIRYIKLMSEIIGIQPEFMPCPWARCLKMLEDGTSDAMLNVFATSQRQQYLEFVVPPISADPPKALFIHVDNPNDIYEFEQLHSMLIGVVRGSSYFKRFDEDRDLRKFEVVDDEQLIDMLSLKRIDTFIGTEAMIEYLLASNNVRNLIKKASFSYQTERAGYLVISKQSPLFTPQKLKEITNAVKQLNQQKTFKRLTEEFYQRNNK